MKISDMAKEKFELFFILLYDNASDIMAVNDSREHLFTQKPANTYSESLKQHIKQARYQCIRALISMQKLYG